MPPGTWVYAAVNPLPEWEPWWNEVEDCLEMRRDFKSITWFVVRGKEGDGSFSVNGKGSHIGYALIESGFLFVSHRYTDNRTVLMHEAYHMIAWVGNEAHPKDGESRADLLKCVPVFRG